MVRTIRKMKNKKEIENCLVSELRNMVSEFKNNTLTEDDIYSYFSTILRDANVDSEIVVKVLEDKIFGDKGKYQALSIKVNEGW